MTHGVAAWVGVGSSGPAGSRRDERTDRVSIRGPAGCYSTSGGVLLLDERVGLLLDERGGGLLLDERG
ncbi:hypothetical protein V2H43_10780, partial [Pasteurella multocida]|uniref:hypothetical protein n=1 Tax=Pasteurella multocida TaxID=747 RepID=UPI002EC8622D|nr:hypothetical protein [Pasteurella multocida]